VPFGVLLLHKLQGWDDHTKAVEKHKFRKRVQDAADVRRLLALPEFVLPLRVVKGGKENVEKAFKGKGRGRNKASVIGKQVNGGEARETPVSGPSTSTALPSSDHSTCVVDSAGDSLLEEQEMWWANEKLFSEEFRALTKQRVWDFCLAFPGRAEDWGLLGFPIPSKEQLEEAKAIAEASEAAAKDEAAEEAAKEAERVQQSEPALEIRLGAMTAITDWTEMDDVDEDIGRDGRRRAFSSRQADDEVIVLRLGGLYLEGVGVEMV